MYDADAFCFYCDKQYAGKKRLVTHIRRVHPGTYAYYSVAGGDDSEGVITKRKQRTSETATEKREQ